MDNLEQLQEKYPEIIQNMQEIEQHTQEYTINGVQSRMVVTIPVVVHVVYKTNAQNISDAQIQSQIDVLNEDFRRLNADRNNTPSVFSGVASDVEIEFCLASVDPDGNSTNGIVRRQTNKPSFSNDNVKKTNKGGSSPWPTGDYLNIWVCNLSGYLGYAQFPGGPASTDGVVCNFQAFGRGNQYQLYANYNLGRTATHEVGHWLNLRHIWGDGGCSVDDFVSDTPLAGGPNYTGGSCTFPGPNSCNEGAGDLPDMFQNYMDYSDDVCMNLFTSGQKTRMQALFSGSRASLLNSNGCGNGGGNDPEICDNGVDDDGDGLVDCDDPDCDADANCQPVGSCDAPTATGATGIGQKKATTNWSAVSGASGYEVRYREVGSSSWSTKSSSSTSANLGGLARNTDYEWEVKTICNGSESAYSNTCTFTTGASGSSSCSGARQMVNPVKAYPNPVSDLLVVEYPVISANQRLIISDVHGRLIQDYALSMDGFIELNVSNLQTGLHFVRILDNEGGLIGSQKVLIQR
jgi:hypothetical protein